MNESEIFELLETLRVNADDLVLNNLKDQNIDYDSFLLLNDNDLKFLGFKLGDRKKIMKYLNDQSLMNVENQREDSGNETREFSSFKMEFPKDNEIFNLDQDNELSQVSSDRSELNKMGAVLLNDRNWLFNDRDELSGKPIQLIKEENGIYSVQKDAIEIIRNLNGNIAICLIAGPHQSGKSFILNQLLNKQEAFEIGSSNVSYTKGIWMWSRPLLHSNENGKFNLLFIDTEGLYLDSSSFNSEQNNKMLVLSLLLSSLFLYNTSKKIDRKDIKQLAFLSKLFKYVNNIIYASDNQINNRSIINSPDFLWIVRDFDFKITNLSSEDYLNEALNLEQSSVNEKETSQVNLIRKSIKESFKSLNCCLLSNPIESGVGGRTYDETLRAIDKVPWLKLRVEFREQITELCSKIKKMISCKSVFATPLSGLSYSKYIELVVDGINTNKPIEIMDIFERILNYASTKSLENAISSYENQIYDLLEENSLPLKWSFLENEHDQIYSNVFNKLQKNLNGKTEKILPILNKFSQSVCEYERADYEVKTSGGKLNQLRKQNSNALKIFYKTKLNELWSELIEKQFFNVMPKENSAIIGLDFLHSYNFLRKIYIEDAIYDDCPEKYEAYNEWFKEHNIKLKIKMLNHQFENISDQIETKIENDNALSLEKASRLRKEKDIENAKFRQAIDKKLADDQINKIDDRLKAIQRELNRKLDGLLDIIEPINTLNANVETEVGINNED